MSKQIQRDAVLERLQAGPATSWQLQQLGICCHTKRISELRAAGHPIEMSEQRRGITRICTYRLSDSEQQRTPVVITCAECHQGVVRKPRAKPLKQGELPFCSDAHRARYHRRKKETVA